MSDAARPLVRSRTFFFALVVGGWLSADARAQQTPPAADPTPAVQTQAQASVAAAPQVITATPTPAPRAPLPNRANELLPSWLRVRGEFRERFEGVAGAGFVKGRDDAYGLSRFRFNATMTASPSLAFQVQAQDARVADKEIGPTTTPFRAAFDLRMAFADIGSARSPVAIRVGRQELVYGDQRLVGHLNWTNAARTFDGVRATFRSKPVQVDIFGTSVVRILDKEFDKSGNGNRFFGAYASTAALIPNSSLEPYVFFKRDRQLRTEVGTTGNLQAATFGARWAGKLPSRLDYVVEMAGQAGSLGSDNVRAWAGHWQLREALPGKSPARVTAEYNFASGDANPTDGTRGTFDQLYPTGHDKLGLSDQVGWRNIRHLRGILDLPPVRKFAISTSVHTWWLAEKRDSLYSAGGASLARVAAGAASAHVGEEIDVQVIRPLTPQLQLAAGYAYVIPGAFLKQATPGASYSFPFVMVTYVFLADK